jgi:hypothetical protein
VLVPRSTVARRPGRPSSAITPAGAGKGVRYRGAYPIGLYRHQHHVHAGFAQALLGAGAPAGEQHHRGAGPA